MSLGERSDKPMPSVPADVSSSYQPQLEPPKREPEKPAPAREWQEGDDVLAPWEPMFLYPGTIAQIKIDEARGDQALIDFDDGGQGWVFVYSLCPLEIIPGQEVHCRRRRGAQYFPAEVLEGSEGDVHVRFHDGGAEWTTFDTLRVPCVENGPGATATKFAPFQPAQATGAAAGSGLPSWVIWIGISILLAFVRIACREMGRNWRN
jgi:hypothetical protein